MRESVCVSECECVCVCVCVCVLCVRERVSVCCRHLACPLQEPQRALDHPVREWLCARVCVCVCVKVCVVCV